jgi:hypothetical protein
MCVFGLCPYSQNWKDTNRVNSTLECNQKIELFANSRFDRERERLQLARCSLFRGVCARPRDKYWRRSNESVEQQHITYTP